MDQKCIIKENIVCAALHIPLKIKAAVEIIILGSKYLWTSLAWSSKYIYNIIPDTFYYWTFQVKKIDFENGQNQRCVTCATCRIKVCEANENDILSGWKKENLGFGKW